MKLKQKIKNTILLGVAATLITGAVPCLAQKSTEGKQESEKSFQFDDDISSSDSLRNNVLNTLDSLRKNVQKPDIPQEELDEAVNAMKYGMNMIIEIVNGINIYDMQKEELKEKGIHQYPAIYYPLAIATINFEDSLKVMQSSEYMSVKVASVTTRMGFDFMIRPKLLDKEHFFLEPNFNSMVNNLKSALQTWDEITEYVGEDWEHRKKYVNERFKSVDDLKMKRKEIERKLEEAKKQRKMVFEREGIKFNEKDYGD